MHDVERPESPSDSEGSRQPGCRHRRGVAAQAPTLAVKATALPGRIQQAIYEDLPMQGARALHRGRPSALAHSGADVRRRQAPGSWVASKV
jgi:hypothetical protein